MVTPAGAFSTNPQNPECRCPQNGDTKTDAYQKEKHDQDSLMPTKKKSTIKIPFNKVTGSVPHWTDPKDYCIKQLQQLQELRAGGFQNPKRSDGSTFWASEQQWQDWIDRRIAEFDFDWREPEEFVDTMQIVGFGRGRSAAYLTLKSVINGSEAVMMMKDLTTMILTANIFKGVVIGRWIFGKRGQNYGIQYVGS